MAKRLFLASIQSQDCSELDGLFWSENVLEMHQYGYLETCKARRIIHSLAR